MEEPPFSGLRYLGLRGFGRSLVAIPGIASVIRRVASVSAAYAWPAQFRLVMSKEIAGTSGLWVAFLSVDVGGGDSEAIQAGLVSPQS